MADELTNLPSAPLDAPPAAVSVGVTGTESLDVACGDDPADAPHRPTEAEAADLGRPEDVEPPVDEPLGAPVDTSPSNPAAPHARGVPV